MKCNKCDGNMQVIEHSKATTTTAETLVYKCEECGNEKPIMVVSANDSYYGL